MSNKEKLLQIANTADEQTLAVLVAMAENYLSQLDEAIDDAYSKALCEKADREYNPSDETTSLEDVMKELGSTKDEL